MPQSAVAGDGSGVAKVDLLISSLPSATTSVTSEQLQLALYMTVSCSCPLMSSGARDDVALTTTLGGGVGAAPTALAATVDGGVGSMFDASCCLTSSGPSAINMAMEAGKGGWNMTGFMLE